MAPSRRKMRERCGTHFLARSNHAVMLSSKEAAAPLRGRRSYAGAGPEHPASKGDRRAAQAGPRSRRAVHEL